MKISVPMAQFDLPKTDGQYVVQLCGDNTITIRLYGDSSNQKHETYIQGKIVSVNGEKI